MVEKKNLVEPAIIKLIEKIITARELLKEIKLDHKDGCEWTENCTCGTDQLYSKIGRIQRILNLEDL